MVTAPDQPTRRTRGQWFGRASFGAAIAGGFLNVTTMFTLNFAFPFLILWYLVEMMLIAVLWAVGGRARQFGTGLAVTLVSVLASVAVAAAATWAGDHLLR